jgi:hypothetical protein
MGIKNRFMNAGRGYPGGKGREQQIAKSNDDNNKDSAGLMLPSSIHFLSSQKTRNMIGDEWIGG